MKNCPVRKLYIRQASLIRPVACHSGVECRRWLIDGQVPSIVNAHATTSTTLLISITATIHITIALRSCKGCAISDEVVAETTSCQSQPTGRSSENIPLNTILHTSNTIPQAHTSINTRLNSQLLVIILLVKHNSSISTINIATAIFPACWKSRGS